MAQPFGGLSLARRDFSSSLSWRLVIFLDTDTRSEYGVRTRFERGCRVFPVSDDSRSVVKALAKYLNENNVQVKLNSRVEEIVVGGGSAAAAKKVLAVKLENKNVITADKVILATGGMSYPQTGSTGEGYGMAKRVGHSITSLQPALVPLETKEKFVKDLQGLSLRNVNVTAISDNKNIRSEFGEMLFTHFGVSGPVILKLSGDMCEQLIKNKKVFISINFKPALDRIKLTNRLFREFSNLKLKSIKNVVKNLLPGKLVPVFIELIGIPEDKKSNQITRMERNRIVDFLTDFRLEILKPRPISEAIVTRGGIPLTEINPYNMESKLVKGLYFCGEIIDVDGITGGYNLQSAFSTGYLAGNI